MPDIQNPVVASLLNDEAPAHEPDAHIQNPALRSLLDDTAPAYEPGAVERKLQLKGYEVGQREDERLTNSVLGLRIGETARQYTRHYMPFGSLVPDRYKPGPRNVDDREYNDAVRRLESTGELSDADAETIALYRHQSGADERIKRDAGPGLRLAQEVGNLGTIGAESIAGGAVVGKGLGAFGKIGQRAGVLSKPTGLPPSPVPASVPRQGLDFAASRVIPTAVSPSVYVQMAQQKNMAEGRKDINDPKGYAPALTYAYANMLVLGQLQKGTGNVFAKGALGASELTAVDALAEGLDKYVLEKQWRTGAKSNVSKYFDALEKGDADEQNRAFTDVAIQTLAFSAMAKAHAGEAHAGEITQRYADTMDALRKGGMSKRQANDSIGKIHTALEDALRENPYLSRAEAKATVAAAATNGTEGYADALANSFEVKPYVPVTKPTESPKPVEPAPVEAERQPVKPTAPEGRLIEPPPETPVKPYDSTVNKPVETTIAEAPKPKPEPVRRPLEVRPDDTLATFEARARSAGIPEGVIDLYAVNRFPGQKRTEKPDLSKSAPDETVIQRRDRLEALWRERNAQESERVRNEVRKGVSPEKAEQASKNRMKDLVRELSEARDEAIAQEAKGNPEPQPVAAAATEPAPEPTRAPPAPSPAEQPVRVQPPSLVPGQRFPSVAPNPPAPGPATPPNVRPEFTGPVHVPPLSLAKKLDKINSLPPPKPVPKAGSPLAAAARLEALRKKNAPVAPEQQKAQEGYITPDEGKVVDSDATGAIPAGNKPVLAENRDAMIRDALGELPEHLKSVDTAPAGERFHTADYKDPSRSVDRAIEMLDRRTTSHLPMETWQDRDNALAQAAHETATFVIDTREYDGAVVGRQGIDNLRPIAKDRDGNEVTPPLRRDPALKSVIFRGPESSPKYAKLKEAVDEANAYRAGLDKPLPPVKLDALDRRRSPPAGSPWRRSSDKPVAAAATVPEARSASDAAKAAASALKKFQDENQHRYDAVDEAADEASRAKAEMELGAWEKTLPPEQRELLARRAKAENDLARANDRQYAIVWHTPDGRTVESARSDTLAGANARLEREANARTAGAVNRVYARDGIDEHGEPGALGIADTPSAGRFIVEPVGFRAGPADGWWDKKIASAEESFKRDRAELARSKPAAPVAAAARPEPSTTELWNELDYDGKKLLAADPVWRSKLEAAGIDVKAGLKKQLGRRLTGNENRPKGPKVLDSLPFDVDKDISTTAMDPKHRDALRLVMLGHTLKDVASRIGVRSQQTAKAWAENALEDLKADPKTSKFWSQFETAGDAGKHIADQNKAIAEGAGREVSEATPYEGDPDTGGVLFSGLPLRLTFLDRFLGKPGESGQGIGSRFRRLFFGGLPESARVAKEQELDQQMAAHAFDMASAEKDFRKALADTGKRYEDLNPAAVKELNDLLQNPDADIPRLAAAAKIPEPIGLALAAMRRHMDLLSQKLMDVGAVPEGLHETFEENKGFYLKRQYQVFADPKWSEKVDKEIVNRFKSWVTQELTPKKGPNKGVAPSPEQVDALTKSLLVDGTAAENPIKFLSESRLGAKDLSILKGRKEIPPELRALWGEYQDPIVNYVNTVASMTHLLTRHQFLTRVAKEGIGDLFFRKEDLHKYAERFPEAGGAVTFSESDNMGPLKDLYTNREIKEAFTDTFSNKNSSALMQMYMKGLVVTKYGKTVLSPVTHARNTWGNVGFVIANGHWRAGHGWNALKAIRDDTPAGREYYRRLTELGIVGESISGNEVAAAARDALGGRELASVAKGPFVTDTMLAAAAKKGADAMTRLYHAEDAVFKIYAFENEKARYAEAYPHWTPKEIEQHAANIVRATYPTYSKVAPWIKALRNLPIAPFVSFPAEVVRTTINTLRIGIGELADKRTRAIGATRLAGLAAAATLSAGIAGLTRAMFGVSQDEEDALRRHLPEYQKDSRLIYFGRDEKGRPKFIDASRTDPHSHLTDALIAFGHGKDTTDGLKKATGELSKPFTQEELFSRALLDVARNERGGPLSDAGGKVYNEQDATGAKARKIGERLIEPFNPGAYSQGRKIMMGLTGKTEEKSGKAYDAGNETQKLVTGQGFEKVDLENSLRYKALAVDKAQADAAHVVNEKIKARGAVSPADLEAARQQTNAARAKLMDEFQRDVKAAERLNMSKGEIVRTLKAAGLSDADVAQALGAPLQPYLPKPNPLGTAPERERAVGVIRSNAQDFRARQVP